MPKNIKIKGPQDVGYVDILNACTDEAIAERVKKKSNPIRPSGAGKCTRELAYGLMEYTGQESYPVEPYTAEVNRIFSSGHALEYDLIKQFRMHCSEFFKVKYTQTPLEIFEFKNATEQELLQNMFVEGSNDLCFVSDEWKCVVDFKTTKEKFSAFYKDSWDEMLAKLSNMKSVTKISETSFWVEQLPRFLEEFNDPFKNGNFEQLNLYAHSAFMRRRKFDHCAIIYYSKNTKRLMEIRFKPSKLVYRKIKKKFETAIAAADIGEPTNAPRDYQLGSVKCAFCDYKDACWPKDDDPLKAFFQTLPKKKWPSRLDKFDNKTRERLEFLHSLLLLGEDVGTKAKAAEAEIIEIMQKNGTWKIELPVPEDSSADNEDGNRYYEIKHFSSLKPPIQLRRTKRF